VQNEKGGGGGVKPWGWGMGKNNIGSEVGGSVKHERMRGDFSLRDRATKGQEAMGTVHFFWKVALERQIWMSGSTGGGTSGGRPGWAKKKNSQPGNAWKCRVKGSGKLSPGERGVLFGGGRGSRSWLEKDGLVSASC